MTKAEKILRFIEEFGPVSLAEIQTFIIRVNHGDQRLETDKAKGYYGLRRKYGDRGYYCTNLYGCGNFHFGVPAPGLLNKFCTQLPDDRWILTEEIKPPFYRMPVETKSFKLNEAKMLGRRQLRVLSWPVCPGCDEHTSTDLTPDGKAHMTGGGAHYQSDCTDRVWLRNGGAWSRGDLTLTTLTWKELVEAQNMAYRLSKLGNDQSSAVWALLREHAVK